MTTNTLPHPDDDAAELAAPTAGGHRYVARAVHYFPAGAGVALCGVAARGSIDTEAPLTCPLCAEEHVKSGHDVEPVVEVDQVDEALCAQCGSPEASLRHRYPAGHPFVGHTAPTLTLEQRARLAAAAPARRAPRRSPAAGRQLALDLSTGAFGATRLGRDADEDGDQLDLFEAVAEVTR